MSAQFLQHKQARWSELLDSITPDIHSSLKTAIELGRWPNGERLSPQQVDLCLQAVIAWEQQRLPETQRVGWIDRSRLRTTQCDDA